jgi:hypothetical protein
MAIITRLFIRTISLDLYAANSMNAQHQPNAEELGIGSSPNDREPWYDNPADTRCRTSQLLRADAVVLGLSVTFPKL